MNLLSRAVALLEVTALALAGTGLAYMAFLSALGIDTLRDVVFPAALLVVLISLVAGIDLLLRYVRRGQLPQHSTFIQRIAMSMVGATLSAVLAAYWYVWVFPAAKLYIGYDIFMFGLVLWLPVMHMGFLAWRASRLTTRSSGR